MELTCFKAYDVRGRVGEQLNPETAARIGRAYGLYLRPRRVAVGGDARLSSPELKAALAEGLRAAGAEVLDLGLCGTEEVYFAVFSQKLDGGVMVTGSHNPITDNGFKFVREESRPLSGGDLKEIQRLAQSAAWPESPEPGPPPRNVSFREEYVRHLLSYIDPDQLRPLTIAANAGNGAAGPVLEALEKALSSLGAPLKFIKIDHQPDGRFPHGVPNPLLPENRRRTSEAVRTHRAGLGLAWDGDFDRCFFFDETGAFIEGYYLVGLLAVTLLAAKPGSAIVHDPRLTWNTVDLVTKAGGKPELGRTGHAFMKAALREKKALYGGEMSAHHYFADFAYCDSGMIPWLMIAELLSRKKQPLSRLVAERQAAFPCSGELNYQVADSPAVLAKIEEHYAPLKPLVSRLDGLSLEFPRWRFNLRASNTEPLLRLNLETRADPSLLAAQTTEIETLIKPFMAR